MKTSYTILLDPAPVALWRRATTRFSLIKLGLVTLVGTCLGFAQRPALQSCPAGNALHGRGIVASLDTSGGVRSFTFSTHEGKIRLDLPEQIAPGTYIQFNRTMEPAGIDEALRSRNASALKNYRLHVAGYTANAFDSSGSAMVPFGAATVNVNLSDSAGQTLWSDNVVASTLHPGSASLPDVAEADANGNFAGTSSIDDSSNCQGKITVEILKDEDGKEIQDNVAFSAALTASEIGGVIEVKFTGSLKDKGSFGTFRVKVVKECQFTKITFKRTIIISPKK